jgi:pimeloyl-ACP methyl ester carboxylesterase
VHGFNNSWKAASATWRATLEQLKLCNVDLDAVVLFYWPGDYSRWQVRSAMNYPRTVPIAEETARGLAEYLERAALGRSVPIQISFVGHSLGSLVVLETIRLLRNAKANIWIHDVLLMAAAVPEGFCVPGEAYGGSFSPETNEAALYSLDDGILKRFFQVGQQIAGRFPENRRRAVGRTGGPGAGFGQRWAFNAHMDGLDHGDYWKKPASVEQIARVVSRPKRNSFHAPGFGATHERQSAISDDTLKSDSLAEDECHAANILFRWLERPLDI